MKRINLYTVCIWFSLIGSIPVCHAQSFSRGGGNPPLGSSEITEPKFDYTILSTAEGTVELTQVTTPGKNSQSVISPFEILVPDTVVYNQTPYAVVSIGPSAFSTAYVNRVKLGKNVRKIGEKAFVFTDSRAEYASLNSALENINLENVESIGDYAFKGCPLSTVQLQNVTFIGNYAFTATESKTENMEQIGPKFTAVDLSHVESLGRYAFSNCTALTAVDCGPLRTVSEGAFQNCPLSTIDCKQVETIEDRAFYIDDFAHQKFSTPLLPIQLKLDKVSALGSQAFQGHRNLISVELGKVSEISTFAFAGCTGLKNIQLGTAQTIGKGAFQGCPLENLDLSRITSIGDVAFIPYYDNCTNRISYTQLSTGILDLRNLTSIGENAFESCEQLIKVSFSKLPTISRNSFSGCINLSSVNFEGVKTIESGAFQGCQLTSLDLKTVQTIGDYAFGPYMIPFVGPSNTSLCIQDLDLKQVKSVGDRAFEGCYRLTHVNLRKATGYGSHVFNGCPYLKSVQIELKTPPAVNDLSIPSRATITVPRGAGPAYRKANYWSDFSIAEADVYLLAIEHNEGGTVSLSGQPLTHHQEEIEVNQGQSYTLQLLPDSGYHTQSLVVNGVDVTHQISNQTYPLTIDNPYTQAVVTFEANDFVLEDQKPFDLSHDEFHKKVQYVRNFSNQNWECLYIPFTIRYDDWKDQFDIAYLNNVHQYDDDDNGTIDRTELEIIKMTSGETEPHTPYLIKAKFPDTKKLKASNVTLKAAESRSIFCSSTRHNYTFVGTYQGLTGQTLTEAPYYIVRNGYLSKVENTSDSLGSYRWYLSITDKNQQPYSAIPSIRIIERGDTSTGIDKLPLSQSPFNIYDLNGRLIKKLAKDIEGLSPGIYLINGKKIIL